MPTLNDDGQTVVLDLHGARVDEALLLARATLALARQRGRARVDLIHGQSTSDGTRRTIRSALHEWLDSGGAGAVEAQRGEAALVLWLDATARPDRRRMTLREVWS